MLTVQKEIHLLESGQPKYALILWWPLVSSKVPMLGVEHWAEREVRCDHLSGHPSLFSSLVDNLCRHDHQRLPEKH